MRCRNPTTNNSIGFLHELFARFGVPDTLVTDNGTQFTSAEFKEFCDMFRVKHITTPPYHPRSNGLAERFVDTLKRALKKSIGTPTEKALQQFLQVYRITPHPSTPSNISPADLMFARKVKSAFDKLLPRQAIIRNTTHTRRKKYNSGDRVYFKCYKNNTSYWECGVVDKRIGDCTYMIKGPQSIHKRHLNQIKKRHIQDDDYTTTVEEEETIDVIYKSFNLGNRLNIHLNPEDQVGKENLMNH